MGGGGREGERGGTVGGRVSGVRGMESKWGKEGKWVRVDGREGGLEEG